MPVFQIPHELGNLGRLRVLDLHGNKLWYFPFSMQNLYHLLRLDLSNNLFDQVSHLT
jgi:Leucine-rich repeat (LRR) protein